MPNSLDVQTEKNAAPSKILDDVERGLRALLYPPDPTFIGDVDKRAQEVYRRLVRGNAYKVVRMGIPILRSLLDDDVVDGWIEKWIDESPPTSRLIRLIPDEFSAWMTTREDLDHPAMAELIHWEILEIGIIHAPDDDVDHPIAPKLEGYLEASNSARLCSFWYPVHRMNVGDPWPQRLSAPVIVFGYRQGESMDWVELPTTVGQTIVHVSQGKTIGDAIASISAQSGHEVEAAFIRSWLVDLRSRGALVGFPDFIDETV